MELGVALQSMVIYRNSSCCGQHVCQDVVVHLDDAEVQLALHAQQSPESVQTPAADPNS